MTSSINGNYSSVYCSVEAVCVRFLLTTTSVSRTSNVGGVRQQLAASWDLGLVLKVFKVPFTNGTLWCMTSYMCSYIILMADACQMFSVIRIVSGINVRCICLAKLGLLWRTTQFIKSIEGATQAPSTKKRYFWKRRPFYTIRPCEPAHRNRLFLKPLSRVDVLDLTRLMNLRGWLKSDTFEVITS